VLVSIVSQHDGHSHTWISSFSYQPAHAGGDVMIITSNSGINNMDLCYLVIGTGITSTLK
jgi:hypothetical protein